MAIRIRLAEAVDIPSLRELIEDSVRGLQTADYSVAQLESALRTVYGVDTQLISDGTYFAAEETESLETGTESTPLLVGCGGWSRRKTLYGGDQFTGREGIYILDTYVNLGYSSVYGQPENTARSHHLLLRS